MIRLLVSTKKLVRSLVNRSGFRVVDKNKFGVLEDIGVIDVLHRWSTKECPIETQRFVLKNLALSSSQIQQDLWALDQYKNKHNPEGRNGFFVEFGATDGVLRSNTYSLEKHYGWRGILCEPARVFKEKLANNRSVAIDNRCVFSETGKQITFHEVESLELSGISDFKHIGGWEEERRNFTEYTVETISLHDLLIQHGAPRNINYMSIDTEGSEYEILRNFPFNEWEIECFSIEHNFSENEGNLDVLMSNQGYKRVLKQVSGFDGWYVRA